MYYNEVSSTVAEIAKLHVSEATKSNKITQVQETTEN